MRSERGLETQVLPDGKVDFFFHARVCGIAAVPRAH